MDRSTKRPILAVALLSALQVPMAHAQTPASPAPTAAASVPSQQLLRAEELDQLVASIALYPDTLLATILMASTYPLEVVQADRWATANKALKGDQLKAAIDQQSWDESVKALVATPSVLAMMSANLDWTQKLGDAVLAQQADVMDAVQRLRLRAQANNKLVTTKEQIVTVTQQQSRQVIVIEPAVPDTIFVPYFDPSVVYGGWPYPAYPPFFFPPPLGFVPGAVLATGIAFGAGYAVGRWTSGGNYWGGGLNWGSNNINVNRVNNINVGNNNVNIGSNNNLGNRWEHNSQHRHGVKYNNVNVQQRFANNNIRAGSVDRTDFRGRGGDVVLRPGGGDGPGNRPNIGDRTPGDRPNISELNPGNRPNIGDRTPGNRPNIGDRTPGDRPNIGDRTPGNRPNIGELNPGNRPNIGDRTPGNRPNTRDINPGNRPNIGGPRRDTAIANIQPGRVANAQAARGRESIGARAAARPAGGGRPAAGPAGGGRPAVGRGGGGGGRGGGGRRSDIDSSHENRLSGRFDSGPGIYRDGAIAGSMVFVGGMAQDLQAVFPETSMRGRDGDLRVSFERSGLTPGASGHWAASGERIASADLVLHAQLQKW